MPLRSPLPLVCDAEEPFLRAILAAPDDEAPRLIYADWLEERGDLRGEYLRLACALASLTEDDPRFDGFVIRLRELHSQIDPQWRSTVARPGIEKCRFFDFRCPKRWDRLQLTGDAAVRFCTACCKEVFYCDSIGEARQHALLGRCVALDPGVLREAGDLDVEEERMLMGAFIDFDEAQAAGLRRPESGGRRGRGQWRFWA
jgi:uncharacterized protein (TIGR02996 family)